MYYWEPANPWKNAKGPKGLAIFQEKPKGLPSFSPLGLLCTALPPPPQNRVEITSPGQRNRPQRRQILLNSALPSSLS